MAFGKKKNPISNKITQTHKISVDGLLDVQENGLIFVEVEELGSVPLHALIREMDGTAISLSVSSRKEDHLEIDLDEEDEIDELTADDFNDEVSL